MKIRTIIIGTILLFFSFTVFSNEISGFDGICRIYTEAQNSGMGKDQLSDYIFDNIKNRISSTDALMAHSAIFNLEPAKRYPIFKESAELSLKHNWDCAAMKSLLR